MATFANRFAQGARPTGHDYSNRTYHTSPEPAVEDNDYLLPSSASDAPLRVHVERVVREYFAALGDEVPTDLYELILKQVELPLLTVVLEQTRGNQTKCAQILGLNRGTLRKKLKMYDLM